MTIVGFSDEDGWKGVVMADPRTCLYVLGGKQRSLLVKGEEEWNLYETALILKLDPSSGTVQTCVEYKSPADARPNEHSACLFKSGTLVDDTLYACTNTEVLVFRLPAFEQLNYISLPCFNDLHHVTPCRDGTLLVVNTGLDMVMRLTPDGALIEEWNVLGGPAWQRFSREVDYRRVASTKPHLSHPNFTFELGGDVWVTRLHQRDALCLTDSGKRIDIALESPHDGLVRREGIYFTLVDGRLVLANTATLAIERVIDFTKIDDPNALLGWCRGVLPVDEERLWVGFSRVRKTRFQDNVLWVKRVFKEGMMEKPTHISLYDIRHNRCLQEFDLEPHGVNTIYSIFPARD
jgi:hypothetical protein